MQSFGGFEHNLQSLRVVDQLEERYPQFDGLNLTFETREGILKHCSEAHACELEAQEPNGVGRRFLDRARPSLEAQLCNLADEIAYNAHDVDDGLRSGLITWEQLQAVPLFKRFQSISVAEFPELAQPQHQRRWIYDVIRRMLSAQVYDVIETSGAAITTAAPDSVDDVRRAAPLIRFSDGMRHDSSVMKRFLFQNLYRHPQVMQTTGQAKQVIADLFAAYMASPSELPAAFTARVLQDAAVDTTKLARVVADYIAGMTDRFASREHERLTGQRLLA